MTIASLISLRNLDLAWSRITTAKNHQHKRMFRHLYYGYEPGRRANIALLHEKLQGGWKATRPIRIYMPKASGLLRPLTLLALEDQIVLQAIANRVARKLFARRKAVQNKVVFSNCIADERDSIFFLQDWRSTYHGFGNRLQRHLVRGNKWIAHFDLAAFYETISHRALQQILAPAGGDGSTWETIRDWLCKWTSGEGGIPVDHGLPQGPIASDFLAEIFLLPLDEAMQKAGIPYIRYVDDIRVLGRTEGEVRRAAIVLELECRRWSLIPQSSKFNVSRADSLAEALGTMPSIAESTGREPEELDLDEKSALGILGDAVKGRPAKVVDKSRLRYVLYRSEPSAKVLKLSLRLLPRHPEHIDAFSAYIQNYGKSSTTTRAIKKMLSDGVLYDYVQGELWLIASSMSSTDDMRELLPLARIQSRRRHIPLPLARGLVAFYLSCRNAGAYPAFNALRRFRASTPYTQSLLIPYLTDEDYGPGRVVSELFEPKTTYPYQQIALGDELVSRGITPATLGIAEATLAPEMKSIFQGLGAMRDQRRRSLDQIGHILHSSYGIDYWRGWKDLLGTEYQYALQILLQAESRYKGNPSGWLASQNSFNDAVFKALHGFLERKNLPGTMALKFPDGRYKNFGTFVAVDCAFGIAMPVIAAGMRAANERRNKIPDSHPYDLKTGKQNKYLINRERDDLKAQLCTVYSEIITVVSQPRP